MRILYFMLLPVFALACDANKTALYAPQALRTEKQKQFGLGGCNGICEERVRQARHQWEEKRENQRRYYERNHRWGPD